MSLFLYFHFSLISLFFFSNHFFSDKYNNMRSTKEKRWTEGTGCTRVVIATWDDTEGADGANRYVFFYFSCPFYFPLLFFSFFFFRLFPFQWSITTGGQDRTYGNAGRDRGQAGTTGTSSVTVFLPILLFSSSHFYYHFCRELPQQMGRDRVGQYRTRQRERRQQYGAGRGTDGREEEVGEGWKAGWWGTWGQLRRRGRRPKNASKNLEGQTTVDNKASGLAGKAERRPGNMAVVLPPPWLLGQGMNNFSPKYNALQML